MKHIKQTDLKTYLLEKTDKELVAEVLTLFKAFPNIKDYYTAQLGDSSEVIEKYKRIIVNKAFPVDGYGKFKLSVGRAALSDFKKVSKSKADTADLMLTFVEAGVDFTDSFGDITEGFYTSLESMFENVMKSIMKNDMLKIFDDRCKDLMEKACDGWGFKGTLEDIYAEAVGND